MKNKYILLWIVAAFVLLVAVLWLAGVDISSGYFWSIAIGAFMIMHCFGMLRHNMKYDESDTSATHDDHGNNKKQHGGCCH